MTGVDKSRMLVATGLAAGANEYIKKPVNLRELKNIVDSYLARSENE